MLGGPFPSAKFNVYIMEGVDLHDHGAQLCGASQMVIIETFMRHSEGSTEKKIK